MVKQAKERQNWKEREKEEERGMEGKVGKVANSGRRRVIEASRGGIFHLTLS